MTCHPGVETWLSQVRRNRDTFRLLLASRKPSRQTAAQLDLADLDAALIGAFLDQLRQAGIDISVIALWLGHESPKPPRSPCTPTSRSKNRPSPARPAAHNTRPIPGTRHAAGVPGTTLITPSTSADPNPVFSLGSGGGGARLT